MPIAVRRSTPADVECAAQICFEAFHQINTAHGFPPDVDAAFSHAIISSLFNDAEHICWVAEQDGRLVGSNCLDERDPIFGLGPITIDPAAQNTGAGRALMAAALDR